MKTKNILIFGVSKFASLMANYLTQDGQSQLAAYIVDDQFYVQNEFEGREVIKFSDLVTRFPPDKADIFCAVGYSSMRARKAVYERIIALGYNTVSYIADTAYVDPSAQVGKNTVVMPGSVVEKAALVGDNVVIWSNATVCHDSSIGDHSFLAANVTVGGAVKVGKLCFLGFSSTILHNVSMADETLLGAMSMLSKNTANCKKYIGIPASCAGSHAEKGICIE